jgi:N-acetylglucosamine-6-sulfatase
MILSFLGAVLLIGMVFSAPDMLVAQVNTATRPNIVVIMTDDQTLEQMRVLTQTRRLIGGQGTNFRNFYVSFPLCCPSRATFITGQYPHNHGVFRNAPPNGGYTKLNNNNTLPVWLQEAGYYTSHVGKYLNGYGKETPRTLVPPGWTDWQGLVDDSTYRFYNYTINDNGTLVTYGETAADYQTDVLANRAVETIDEAVSHQPFFLSIAPVPPHLEFVSTGTPDPATGELTEALAPPRPAPRDVGAFSNEPLPKPPSYNEADVSDKPAEIRNRSLISASEEQKITARYRGQLASLLAIDDLVERVVNELAATGILNNTVIIFTSDNGFFHGEHRIRTEKFRVYEEDVHLPLLIRGPGFPQGATRRQFVSNIDLAPTIVDLANASPGLVMDGRSLVPLAQNATLATSRNLLIETLAYKAVRNKSFVYVEHRNGEQELYDMRKGTANYDPYQLQSQHANSAYSQIKGQLAATLNKLHTCSGESCARQQTWMRQVCSMSWKTMTYCAGQRQPHHPKWSGQ